MLESATIQATATNLIIESVGIATGYIINGLKAFFSNTWAGNILLAILIGVSIMTGIASLLVWKHRQYREIFDTLLKSDKVELKHSIGKGLFYIHPEHDEWEQFINIVNGRLRYKLLKYRAPRLCGKVKKACVQYKKSYIAFNQKSLTIFMHDLEKEELGCVVWDGMDDQPLEDYVEKKRIPNSIEGIIVKNEILRIGKSGDGRYTLIRPHTIDQIAKSTSKAKIEGLKKLMDTLAKNNEIEDLITKRNKAKKDVDEFLKKYNKKLDTIIRDIKFCLW